MRSVLVALVMALCLLGVFVRADVFCSPDDDTFDTPCQVGPTCNQLDTVTQQCTKYNPTQEEQNMAYVAPPPRDPVPDPIPTQAQDCHAGCSNGANTALSACTRDCVDGDQMCTGHCDSNLGDCQTACMDGTSSFLQMGYSTAWSKPATTVRATPAATAPSARLVPGSPAAIARAKKYGYVEALSCLPVAGRKQPVCAVWRVKNSHPLAKYIRRSARARIAYRARTIHAAAAKASGKAVKPTAAPASLAQRHAAAAASLRASAQQLLSKASVHEQAAAVHAKTSTPPTQGPARIKQAAISRANNKRFN